MAVAGIATMLVDGMMIVVMTVMVMMVTMMMVMFVMRMMVLVMMTVVWVLVDVLHACLFTSRFSINTIAIFSHVNKAIEKRIFMGLSLYTKNTTSVWFKGLSLLLLSILDGCSSQSGIFVIVTTDSA